MHPGVGPLPVDSHYVYLLEDWLSSTSATLVPHSMGVLDHAPWFVFVCLFPNRCFRSVDTREHFSLDACHS